LYLCDAAGGFWFLLGNIKLHKSTYQKQFAVSVFKQSIALLVKAELIR